jgi:type II secretory pathway component HofQ
MRLTAFGFYLVVLASCAHRSPAPPPEPTIDIDVKDMPIHDALQLLGTRARMNFSLDPDIEGTVTLTLRAVPARVVLDAIVRDHGLKVTPQGKLLRISRAATPVVDQVFTGEPITLDVTDAPIRDVTTMIARHSKLAIVVDDDVDVAVTQRAKGVPWDQVLEHVARKYGLRVVRDGATLRITR